MHTSTLIRRWTVYGFLALGLLWLAPRKAEAFYGSCPNSGAMGCAVSAFCSLGQTRCCCQASTLRYYTCSWNCASPAGQRSWAQPGGTGACTAFSGGANNCPCSADSDCAGNGGNTSCNVGTGNCQPPPNVSPTCMLLSPPNGQAYAAPATIPLQAWASDSDGTVTSVIYYYWNGASYVNVGASGAGNPFTASWGPLAGGSYQILCQAWDNAGAWGNSALNSFTVTSALPTVSIISPANGATFTAPANVNLQANATDSDGSVTQVAYYTSGGALIGTSNSGAPWTVPWNSLAAGTYSIYARATDNSGGLGTSATISFTVNAAAGLVSSSFSALVRGSRRGQLSYSTTAAPGTAGANTRDTDDNVNDFGTWNSSSTLNVHTWASGTFPAYSGSPLLWGVANNNSSRNCRLSPTNCQWVQVNDPFSLAMPADMVYFTSSTRVSTAFQIPSVAGPDSFQSNPSIPNWEVIIGGLASESGGAMAQFGNGNPAGVGFLGKTTVVVLGRTSATDPTTRRWSLITSTPTITPPQACTGGACDTSQDTISGSTTFDPNTLSYGTNPDSKTPYATVGALGCSYLRLYRVTDQNTLTIPGTSITFIDSANRFQPFEKVTDANGNILIMLPIYNSGQYTMRVNWPTPPRNDMAGMHFYNPQYLSYEVTQNYTSSYGCGNYGLFGSDNITSASGNATVGPGGLAYTDTVAYTAPSASISGQVLSIETGGGLNGQVVELRDSSGNLFTSTITANTGASGSYSFTGLTGGTYFVTVVTDRKVSQTAPYLRVIIADAQASTGNNLSLRGVPAIVSVTTGARGTYVLVGLTSLTVGALPPTMNIKAGSASNVYTTMAGHDRIATLYVGPGNTYAVTCWEPTSTGTFVKRAAVNVNSGAAVNPGQTYSVSCP